MQAQSVSPEIAASLATQIVVAFLQRESIDLRILPRVVRDLRIALGAEGDFGNLPSVQDWILPDVAASSAGTELGVAASAVDEKPAFPGAREPAVPVKDSVHDEFLISLEDGKKYRSLRRHLMAKYGMTPDDYRSKWNLPSDYPMVAPSYARERSAVAKRIGLGQSRSASKSPAKRTRLSHRA